MNTEEMELIVKNWPSFTKEQIEKKLVEIQNGDGRIPDEYRMFPKIVEVKCSECANEYKKLIYESLFPNVVGLCSIEADGKRCGGFEVEDGIGTGTYRCMRCGYIYKSRLNV
jgi:hypothetical protein